MARGGGGHSSSATGAGTRVDVTLKLPQLQNLCKRDPVGYRDDYDAQARRLESELGLLTFGNNNNSPSDHVVELIQFVAAVCSSSYKGVESDRVAGILQGLLRKDVANLHRDVRKAVVSALILMRNKGTVAPLHLLELFFSVMSTVSDKNLRELLFRHMVNDIRNINKKGKRDDKVNRSVQTFLHKVVQNNNVKSSDDATEMASKRAVDMVCELYRRNVWTDDRTVAIVASAVESTNMTVASRAMRFFLNIEEKMAEDKRLKTEGEWFEKNGQVDLHLYSRKTKRRQRQAERAMKNKKKAQQKKDSHEDWMDATPEHDKGVEAAKKLYPAMELLRDPQGLAESVLRRLKSGSSSLKYENKLLMINFVTRLVGNHELLVLPLYTFLQKYLGGHQRDVTAVLAYTVQACHVHVPPDDVYGILQTIAHNFVTERCSEEQMAVGINAIRAICSRVPSCLATQQPDERTTALAQAGANTTTNAATHMDVEAFARDLAAYAGHRDRSVGIAGKAWLNFVREVHPALLPGKDRGSVGAALYKAGGAQPLRYGESNVAVGVEGSDLLVEYEAKKAAARQRRRLRAQDSGEQGSNYGSSNGDSDEDSTASGEWEDIDDDDEDDDDAAPSLVRLDGDSTSATRGGDVDDEGDEDDLDDNEGSENDDEESNDAVNEDEVLIPDLSKMSAKERDQLKQHVSSTRIFTTEEFAKMQKLVEREKRAKRDPREAARRKRAKARGDDFEALSDDDDNDLEDETIRIKGAVNPEDIMALATRKRQSKADKLEKILAGRTKFESKKREGGSTNVEKTRKKNFLMSKFSKEARTKGRGKGGLQKKKREMAMSGTHEAKKRRRKV